MLNDKDKERFEYMVNESVDDMMHAQVDEEPTSARFVAMDDAMTKPYKDEVHNPSHYQVADQSVQDIIKLSFTHQEYMGWLRGNIIKYRMRAGIKNKDTIIQDLDKANKYQEFYNRYLKENDGTYSRNKSKT